LTRHGAAQASSMVRSSGCWTGLLENYSQRFPDIIFCVKVDVCRTEHQAYNMDLG
jgi:hypothetical protein